MLYVVSEQSACDAIAAKDTDPIEDHYFRAHLSGVPHNYFDIKPFAMLDQELKSVGVALLTSEVQAARTTLRAARSSRELNLARAMLSS